MKYLPILLLAVLIALSSCQQKKSQVETPLPQGELTTDQQLQLLDQKIEAAPNDPSLHVDKSRYLLDLGRPNDALRELNQALEIDSTEASIFIVLSDVYLTMGRFPQSLESLQKAEELDPENNEGLVKQAELYLILQDYRNVFEYVKKALQVDAYNPVAYFIRAYAFLETGDTMLAVRDLVTATEQDQSYFKAFMQLGLLYAQKNDPLAQGYYENAIKSRPDHPEGYYFLGMYYQETEQIPKAVETYEQLLRISPDYKEAYYNLGYLNLVYLGDYQQAVTYFSEAIMRDSVYVDAYYNRGYSYELNRQPDKAWSDYKKVLELSPNYELALKAINRIEQ